LSYLTFYISGCYEGGRREERGKEMRVRKKEGREKREKRQKEER
jgi:hypothetical protein